jgi:signal transduction histidine kinase
MPGTAHTRIAAKLARLAAIILFWCSNSLSAQENYPLLSVSITNPNQQVDLKTRLLLNKLIDKGNAILKTDADSAIVVYKKVEEESRKHLYLRGESIANNNMSAAYKQKNDYTNALLYMQKSLQVSYVENGNALLNKYVGLSDIYYNTGNYQAILELYHGQFLRYRLHYTPDVKLLSRLHKYIAIAHLRSGHYDSAMNYYYRILADMGEPDAANFTVFVETYNGIGAISGRIGSNNHALIFFDKALALATKYNDTNQINMCMGNKAGIYINIRDYAKAKEICLQALAISRKMNYDSYRSLNANRMAHILNASGQYQEALAYCMEAYASARRAQNFDNQIAASYITSYTYIQLQQYDKAEGYLLPAFRQAQEKGRRDNITDAYTQLATIYAHTGRYKEAYQYMDLYARSLDSLNNTATGERIAEAEGKLRTARKEQQLAEERLQFVQNANKLREKNFWISAIALGSVLFLLIAGFRYKHKQKLQQEKMTNLAQQQEIERLNARMQGEAVERERIAKELHDGISVLLSAAKMNYTVLGKEQEQIATTPTYLEVMRLLNETGQEVRAISYNLVPELLIQQSLPAAIQSFCTLIRKGHHIAIEVQSYGSFNLLPKELSYSIYRIVQELVHNTIKHAQATNLLLQLIIQENTLFLTAEDDGIGFDEKKSPEGMGLLNLKNRVEQLNGHLGCTSVPGTGTTVEIEIPVT